MTAFDRLCTWCDSLPRDKQGLPPCQGCVMHAACSSSTGPLAQASLDSWTERAGAEFVRLVEAAA